MCKTKNQTRITSSNNWSKSEILFQNISPNNAYDMEHGYSKTTSDYNSIIDAVDEPIINEIAIVDQRWAVDEPHGEAICDLVQDYFEADQIEWDGSNDDSCQQWNKLDIIRDLKSILKSLTKSPKYIISSIANWYIY